MNFSKENVIILRVDNQWNNLYITFYEKETKKVYYHQISTFKNYFYHSDIDQFILDKTLVKKVYIDKPWKMKEISAPYKNTYENDLDLKKRFLCDFYRGVKQIDKVDQKIVFLDIEVLMTGEFRVDGSYPVTAITIYNLEKKEYITFAFYRSRYNMDPVSKIYIFNDEYEMLKAFVDYWRNEKFNIVSGWHIKFDINYICFRLLRIDNEYNTDFLKYLSPFQITQQKWKTNDWEIFGISIIDYLTIYKKYTTKEVKSYKLNNVALKELGEEKLKYDEYDGNLNLLYENNFNKYIEYNRKDVELVVRLDEKKKFLDLLCELNTIGINNLEDSIDTSKILDSLFIRILNGINKVVKSKVWGRNKKDYPYPGGYVYPVKLDMYLDNPILTFDVSSLYPSIVRMLNISMETIDSNSNLVSGSNLRFTDKRPGILKQFEAWCFSQKEYYGKLKGEAKKSGNKVLAGQYDSKRSAYKINSNGITGMMGFVNCRFFNTNMKENLANAITTTGQLIIQAGIYYIEKLGWKVIYSDTDSVGITNENLKGKDIKEVVEIGQKLNKELDEKIRIYLNKRFNIKEVELFSFAFEKISKGIHTGIRHYVHRKLWNEGIYLDELDFKGVEVVRADCPDFSDKMMRRIYNEILINNKTNFVEINNIVKEYREQLKQIPLESLGFPFSLSKLIEEYKVKSPHITGCKYYLENIMKGNMDNFSLKKGKYYYVLEENCPSNLPKTDVISLPEGVKFPREFKMDMNRVSERFIDKKIKRVMMILVNRDYIQKYSFEDLIKEYNITTKKRKYLGNQTVWYLSEDPREETKYILYVLNNDVEIEEEEKEDNGEEFSDIQVKFGEEDQKIIDEILKY